jgi:hypothetical protein
MNTLRASLVSAAARDVNDLIQGHWRAEYSLLILAMAVFIAGVVLVVFARRRYLRLQRAASEGKVHDTPAFEAQLFYNRARIAFIVIAIISLAIGLLALARWGSG